MSALHIMGLLGTLLIKINTLKNTTAMSMTGIHDQFAQEQTVLVRGNVCLLYHIWLKLSVQIQIKRITCFIIYIILLQLG